MRNRVALTTAYAAGLRVGEVVRLKIGSIDSERMLLHIEGGKENSPKVVHFQMRPDPLAR